MNRVLSGALLLAIVVGVIGNPTPVAAESQQKPLSESIRQPLPAGELERYRLVAFRHLAKFRPSPAKAKKFHAEGTVMVYFVINKRGRVTLLRLAQTSGFAVLDGAALEIVRRASPFPPIPARFGVDQLRITAPVQFTTIRIP